MKRFTKIGVILAIAGALLFFSSVDNIQVFAQSISPQGKPAPGGATLVTVTNTPLPVSVTNFPSSEPSRDCFGISLIGAPPVSAHVQLSKPAVIESIAGLCVSGNGAIKLYPASGTDATVSGTGATLANPELFFYLEAVSSFLPPVLRLTQLFVPTGTYFDLQLSSGLGGQCLITIVVRYTP